MLHCFRNVRYHTTAAAEAMKVRSQDSYGERLSIVIIIIIVIIIVILIIIIIVIILIVIINSNNTNSNNNSNNTNSNSNSNNKCAWRQACWAKKPRPSSELYVPRGAKVVVEMSSHDVLQEKTLRKSCSYLT